MPIISKDKYLCRIVRSSLMKKIINYPYLTKNYVIIR